MHMVTESLRTSGRSSQRISSKTNSSMGGIFKTYSDDFNALEKNQKFAANYLQKEMDIHESMVSLANQDSDQVKISQSIILNKNSLIKGKKNNNTNLEYKNIYIVLILILNIRLSKNSTKSIQKKCFTD